MFDLLHGLEVGQLTQNTQSAGGVALLFPGWIGYGFPRADLGYPSQFSPLVRFGGSTGVLRRRFSKVYAVNYKGAHRAFPRNAVDVCSVIRQLSAFHPDEQMTLLGVSYGATELMYGLGQLWPKEFHNKRVVLIDPPGGAGSLVKLNSYGPIGRRLSQSTLKDLPEWLNKPLLQHAFNQIFCQGLAASDVIEVPQGVEDTEQYIARVREEARLGQQGFTPTLSLEQIGLMANLHQDETYVSACRHVNVQLALSEFSVRILTCTDNNQVVVPAVTKAFYRRLIPDADFIDFPTNHTNFLQRPQFWNEALDEILS